MNYSKILVCPKCGSDCSSVIPGNIEQNQCPYCGFEIYDYSEYNNQQKIEEVQKAKKKVLSVPAMVALTIVITLVVLLGGTALFYMLHLDHKSEEFVMNYEGDKYAKKMAKCYENQDWDGLFNIVILDCENSIGSPSYFAYRTAWFLSCYPQEFDEAYKNGDTARMKEIYSTIKEDYKMREDDFFYSMYETIDEVETGLAEEYQRETDIMQEIQ